MNAFSSLFLKKEINQILLEANNHSVQEGLSQKKVVLRRTLGSFHLTLIGVGAILGAGIFSLVGTTAAYYAGPGIVYSFLLAGLISILAGLCYAELAAMLPVSGSAYTYAYATLGEVVAWIIGWDLILEYTFGAVVIAASWSGYFCSLLIHTLGVPVSDFWMRMTQGPFDWVTLSDGTRVTGFWNLPATGITLVLSWISYRGIRESAWISALMVIIKMIVLLVFILLGWAVVDVKLWIANPLATGFSRWVPPPSVILKNGQLLSTYGWQGVITGAGVVFFAFIGFDMISTMAQECKKPSRNLPIGILGSLLICTVFYILVSLVMTGIIPFSQLGVADPIAVGIDRIVALRGGSKEFQLFITCFVKSGAIAGLTAGLLVVIVGQSRIFYAMASDGLLPWFSQLHKKYATPHLAVAVTSVSVAVCAGILPIYVVGELVSIGTLLAFTLVFVGVPILRWTHPDVKRAFRMPIYGVIAPAGALICLWVMAGLPYGTWLRLISWLSVGFIIYFGYGRRFSKVRSAGSISVAKFR